MERRTVSIYEEQARVWQARRRRRRVDDADAVRMRSRLLSGAIRADIGCGPGEYLTALGTPVVAMDAAWSMLELAGEADPGAWRVRADLEALPFRRRSLGGAWSRATYVHIPRARLPLALADLQQATAVGAPVYLDVRRGDREGPRPGDDFPGRFFAEWREAPLRDVVVGAGFEIDELVVEPEWMRVWARRVRTLPDTVGLGMRLLVCGLNPSLYAADAGVGYARPGNRFWPAARAAGLTERDRDARDAIVHHGVGMTDLVKRATGGAAELTGAEYREGAARVERLVRWLRPAAVCFVGLTGWRAAVDPQAGPGEQPHGFGGIPAYVMPSTSGANAHARLDELIDHLRAAAALGRVTP